MLLGYKCSPEILSMAIPIATKMKVRSERLKAMQSLTQKGIEAKELGISLQMVVAEEGSVDYEIVCLLLKHKAPLNDDDDNSQNAVLVATQRGLVPLLQLLCEIGPRKETLSNAIPMAFNAVHVHSYDIAFDMMNLLFQHGAMGKPVHQTLLNAAKEDRELRITKLLLDYGANANYRLGASFGVAIEWANFELLQLLCTKCPPTPRSTKANLFLALKPNHFNQQALDLLLKSTPNVNVVLDDSWSSERFRMNCNIAHIIRCFLRHGMNVDLGNGSLACFAIQERETEVLREVLAAKPTLFSLREAFKEAAKIQERKTILLYLRLLLGNAKSAEIGQTAVLLKETINAMMGDTALFEVLLEHKADVNFEKGITLQTASAAGSLEVMSAILARRPTMRSKLSACLVTATSTMIDSNQKDVVFERLLDSHGGVTPEGSTIILAKTVELLPEFTQLPELLLVRGAVVSIDNLKVAVMKSSQALFTLLANNVLSADTLSHLFRHSCDQRMKSDRRYWIYKYLLGRGMNKDDISEALLKSLTVENLGDLSLSKLLLDNGASVQYKNGAAFSSAFALNSFDVVSLLSHHIDGDKLANIAFDLARNHTSLGKDTRYGIYQCFLDWNITEHSIQCALVENLATGVLDADIVELLLRHGADPNKDSARCFRLATRSDAEDEFRALNRYGKPDLELVLKSLLEIFKDERRVVRWFNICLEESLNSTRIRQENLLFQCMRTFPDGTSLLKLLLAKGVSAGAKVNTRVCPGWKSEMCTAVIWALRSTKPRLGNAPILTLLSQGKKKALPAYSTPISKVSAAFVCLLDDTRTEVLKALLELDMGGVMEHTMLESKFTHMAAYPRVEKSDPSVLENTNELTVLSASIFTGNFKAFHLLQFACKPDDGTLIIAVVLALPKFIQWLFAHGHNPNYRDESTNMMIPLAILCSAKYHPFCKIANKELDLPARRKQSMKLLAPKTDLSLKYRGKTVLHYALEEGPEVTRAMIEALNILLDEEKNEKYLYVDRDGIHYSPDQYVKRFVKIDETQKIALVNILNECGMMSRYYKDVKPGEGEQPVGFKGLPKQLGLLWECVIPMHDTHSMEYQWNAAPSHYDKRGEWLYPF